MNSLRNTIVDTNSFVSVPGAFQATTEKIRYVPKLGFKTSYVQATDKQRSSEFGIADLQLETAVIADWLLLDMGALDPSAIETERIIKDCEFLINIATNYPTELNKLIAAFQPDAPIAAIDEAIELAKTIGFTEEASAGAGGGLIFVAIAIGAGLLLSGCAHCKGVTKNKGTTPAGK